MADRPPARPALAAPVPGFDDLDDLDRAACLLAVDPAGLGGLCLRGPADEAREQAQARLRHQLAPTAATAWRRLPAQIDDQRLLGGIDLGLSLAAGRPVHQPGVLAESAQGVLLLPLAERAPPALTARLAMALDASGDGSGPCFALIALDDSQADDPPLAPPLMERLALVLHAAQVARADGVAAPSAVASSWPTPLSPSSAAIPALDRAAARAQLARLPFDADAAEALVGAAAAFGLHTPRTAWQAWRAACVAAACAGRNQVAAEDVQLAARLVLAPRARCLPAPPAEADEPAPPESADPPPPPDVPREVPPEVPPPPPADAPAPPDLSGQDETQVEPLDDRLIEATQAAIPPGLLALLAGQAPGVLRSTTSGRAGLANQAGRRGRPVASRRGPWRDGARLDLPATLRAALPWQTLRRQARAAAGLPPATTRMLLRRDDLHLRRFRHAPGTTTIFAVDASGSQAMHRLAEAKGAVECLLADCYVRRDRVALIAFRGERAEALLAPTRSLVRARRSLAALPGGGGTPLAAGIEAACDLALQVQRRDGDQAVLVFLTDARANIARDGSPGRERAMADALQAARPVRAAGLRGLLIDTSPRPQLAAAALADAMALRYVALPQGSATAVYAAVAGVVGGA